MIRYSADVVVIGAGIAGVTAAIELLARGRSVVLLDRDVESNLGGLAKESFGGLWFAGTALQRRYGIRDGAEQGLCIRVRGLGSSTNDGGTLTAGFGSFASSTNEF